MKGKDGKGTFEKEFGKGAEVKFGSSAQDGPSQNDESAIDS